MIASLDKIIKTKNLNAKEIKEILEQLNNVFKIMYKNSIIHRDIKPENILIKNLENNKCLYKLTDYGFSKLTQKNKAEFEKATDGYTAPEIINNPEDNKSKVDYGILEFLFINYFLEKFLKLITYKTKIIII